MTRETQAPAAPLAVFDLDGTLLRGDSFLPFLVSYAARRRRLWPLVVLPVYVMLYLCRVLSDRRAKERLLVAFFRGESLAAIREHAERFCAGWVARKLRPEVVARLRQHQQAGHRVILLSASPDLYVRAIGEHLGIAEVLATRVCTDGERCAGRIDGDNCKGEHKVARLRAYLGCDAAPAGSSSYGDSPSDLPVLRWVQHGYLVTRGELVEVEVARPSSRS